ncbi:hypothetical protein CRUP_029693 [Coryphaenoides rupestris]|nr:hypothetical protein CRUP_029693 [Coryphaenoides rupestris]
MEVTFLGILYSQLFCLLAALNGYADCSGGSSNQMAHFSSYQLTVPRLDPVTNKQRRDVSKTPPNQVSYSLSINGTEHLLHLQRNQLLLAHDFTVFTYSRNGTLVASRPPVQDHCHYQGYVEGMEGSAVAMSICNGLRGVLHLSNDSFGIEPLDSDPHQHIVYRLQDVTSQPKGCGTPHTEHGGTEHAQYGSEDIHQDIRHHTRVRRAILHKTHYVELFLVVDHERYIYMNRNATAVREQMVQLANYIDSMYVALNIRVVLVGLEIWAQQNQLSIEGSAGEVLSRFTQWREKELVPRHRHDSAQLILKKSFGGTAGMAFVSTVCSRSHGGGINAFTNNNVASFASIVAHELGHNLGMNHDDGRECAHGSGACIMNSGATGSRNFSSCSSDDFEKMILATGGTCLLNVPRPDEAYSTPYCGNKLLDIGEDCDCGSEKYLPGGTVCRESTDQCDLPEYCNGSTALCQSDVFIQRPKPLQRNAMCGKLQCSNVHTTVFGIQPSIITTPIGGTKCFGVDFMLGSDVPDPGMVSEGTRCGDNKVCLNFECGSADVLKYDCVQTKCHGHGLSGYGGSVDSGPTWNDKDTSVRDGLLVFFFLVLPLLVLGAFVFLRRNDLPRLLGLGRRKRSQGYEADSRAPANPSRGPPPRGPPPAAVTHHNPNGGVRDGHQALLHDEQPMGRSEPSGPGVKHFLLTAQPASD